MTLERSAPPENEAEVRANISRARAQLLGTANALRREVKGAWDVRRWIRRHPTLILGAAFVFGAWAGSRRRNPLPRRTQARIRKF
jgi:hypothetical protein